METGHLKESEVGQQLDQCFSFDHCSQRVKDWIDHAQKGPDVSTMPAKFFTVEVFRRNPWVWHTVLQLSPHCQALRFVTESAFVVLALSMIHKTLFVSKTSVSRYFCHSAHHRF